MYEKYYLHLEDKNVFYEGKDPKKSIPFYTSFTEQRKGIDKLSALYSVKAPFELMHADIRLFFKSAVDPKYCLLVVNVFAFKTYT